MKKIILILLVSACTTIINAQMPKTELYDIVKKLLTDSTGYENIGDWAVSKPAKYPVKWKSARIEMSPDTSINFFRAGMADITVNGRNLVNGSVPVKWNIMLKGPRMGFSSFSIISTPATNLKPQFIIDSLFGKKPYNATLLKSCNNQVAGYYYYKLKLPKKDEVFIKVSWLSVNNQAAIRIDGFDNYSKYAAKLQCK